MSELKSCPFCGGRAVLQEGMGEVWALCLDCVAGTRMMSTRDAAAAKWNTRAPVKCACDWLKEAEQRMKNDG